MHIGEVVWKSEKSVPVIDPTLPRLRPVMRDFGVQASPDRGGVNLETSPFG